MITITNHYTLVDPNVHSSFLMRDSKGDFYVLGHQDATAFISAVQQVLGTGVARVPSEREVAYGYAKTVEDFGPVLKFSICSKADPHAFEITRWTYF